MKYYKQLPAFNDYSGNYIDSVNNLVIGISTNYNYYRQVKIEHRVKERRNSVVSVLIGDL